MTDDALPEGVGPHEGRELELLLSGKKPVARFALDGLDAEYEARFEEAVFKEVIVKFEFEDADDAQLNRRYYCLPAETWRVKLMEMIFGGLRCGLFGDFSEEDLHRMDGALLGYAPDDIEAFILHWRGLRKDLAQARSAASKTKRDDA